MTKEEFKSRWESSADGGKITWEEVAEAAKGWGLHAAPRTRPMNSVLRDVLRAADCRSQEADPDDLEMEVQPS